MNKRGQGISINMVIIVAIALIVLVIAVILVSKAGRNADQNAGAKSCIANGGVCKDSCAADEQTLTEMVCSGGQDCCRYDFNG